MESALQARARGRSVGGCAWCVHGPHAPLAALVVPPCAGGDNRPPHTSPVLTLIARKLTIDARKIMRPNYVN